MVLIEGHTPARSLRPLVPAVRRGPDIALGEELSTTSGRETGTTAPARGLPRLIPQLTGIRALAALWVACFHFRPYLLESFPQTWPLMPLFNVGHLGVDLFFILSGFILTFTHLERMSTGWGPRKVLGFLWLRLSRVWPVTMVMLLVYGAYRIAQTWITGDASYAASLDARRLLMHVLLIQSWGSEHHDWNPIDWSISAEWMAYLVFGVFVLFLAKAQSTLRTRSLVLLAGAALMPMVIVGMSLEDGSDLAWNGDEIVPGIVALRVLTEFFAGALVALVVRRVASSGRRVPVLLRPAALVAAIVAVIYLLQKFDPVWRPRFGQEWGYHGHSLWGSTESVIVVPLFALLIGSLALSRGGVSKALSHRALVWGGQISFAFYLVHWFFLDLMLFVIGRTEVADEATSLARQGFVIGALMLSVLAGWALFTLVEEPMRKGMRKMLPRSLEV